MKTRWFPFLFLVTGIVSEFTHPNMQTSWVPISVATYSICGFLAVLALLSRKKNRTRFMRAIAGAVVVFTEYAIITAVAYLRMVDTIIADGAEVIGVTIVATIVFAVIVFWDDVKKRFHIQKK